MKLPYHVVDAFTDRRFGGNQAGVVPLERWLDDAVLQSIAAENNLAETAFFVPRGDGYELRWFTPELEVDLCGHATLATAWVLMRRLGETRAELRFHSKSGELVVRRDGERLALDFPASTLEPAADVASALALALGRPALETLRARDLICRLEHERDVRALTPDIELLRRLPVRGVIVTAPGENCDYVFRFFAPAAGIPEDAATGSAQCMLVPFWSTRLERAQLHSFQLSKRGAEFWCRAERDRVLISGNAAGYLEGSIEV